LENFDELRDSINIVLPNVKFIEIENHLNSWVISKMVPKTDALRVPIKFWQNLTFIQNNSCPLFEMENTIVYHYDPYLNNIIAFHVDIIKGLDILEDKDEEKGVINMIEDDNFFMVKDFFRWDLIGISEVGKINTEQVEIFLAKNLEIIEKIGSSKLRIEEILFKILIIRKRKFKCFRLSGNLEWSIPSGRRNWEILNICMIELNVDLERLMEVIRHTKGLRKIIFSTLNVVKDKNKTIEYWTKILKLPIPVFLFRHSIKSARQFSIDEVDELVAAVKNSNVGRFEVHFFYLNETRAINLSNIDRMKAEGRIRKVLLGSEFKSKDFTHDINVY